MNSAAKGRMVERQGLPVAEIRITDRASLERGGLSVTWFRWDSTVHTGP